MRQQGIAVSRVFTVALTEEQWQYLTTIFRERLESHRIRGKTGYPQDERGAFLAMDLWEAFLGASLRDSQDQRDDHADNGNRMVRSKSAIEKRELLNRGGEQHSPIPEVGDDPSGGVSCR